MRKHINLIAMAKQAAVPFDSWNCLTLSTARKDFDIVIKDDHQMLIILRFLIQSIRSVDGQRGSADKIFIMLKM